MDPIISISLAQWVALSSLCEAQIVDSSMYDANQQDATRIISQHNVADVGSNNNNGRISPVSVRGANSGGSLPENDEERALRKKEAQLSYLDRAARMALLLLGSLTSLVDDERSSNDGSNISSSAVESSANDNGPSNFNAGAGGATEISMENFTVSVSLNELLSSSSIAQRMELNGFAPNEISQNESLVIDKVKGLVAKASQHFLLKKSQQIRESNGFNGMNNLASLQSLDLTLEENELLAIVEGVTDIHLAESLRKSLTQKYNGTIGSNGTNNRNQYNSILKQLGLLLYRLFCRGQGPPPDHFLQETSEADNNKMANNPIEKNGRQGETDHEDVEEPGSEKGRRKHSFRSTCKSFRKMAIGDDIDEALRLHGVPTSICRLVMDLICSGDSADGADNGLLNENAFESLAEVAAELKQIMSKPELFLRDWDANRIQAGQLDFGKNVYGRSEECQRLLEAAASVPMEAGSLVNRLVLIGGHSGSGKSYLVKSLEKALVESGWLFISSKFDLQRQPLLTIASAFESFFASMLASRENSRSNGEAGVVDDEEENPIITAIGRCLSASAIVVLSDLMPSLGALFPGVLKKVVSDPDMSSLIEDDASESGSNGNSSADSAVVVEEEEVITSAETIKNRLHYLFRRLIYAISSPGRPILFFLDDLQWADKSSLDLISSLLLEFDHLEQFEDNGGDEESPQCILFVGAFRSNEVDSSHILVRYCEAYEESDAVEVTNIPLEGFSWAGANAMVSETLRLPTRLTKSLTNAILSKTLGNPFHIKTFMQSLVSENALRYSLLEKRWVWNIDAVKSMDIDQDVAQLLARNMRRLPPAVQAILKLISCFGSQVDEQIIQVLASSEEMNGLYEGLECATSENILEKKELGYAFSHDMLQQAAYSLMTSEECGEYHFNIGMQLISSIPLAKQSHFNPVVFAAIDQINRAKAFGVTDPSLHINFATLNLKAGERSIEVSDFASALSYVEYGMSFLPEKRWESHYELTLKLYESACLTSYINADRAKLLQCLEDLLANAECFEDTLKGYFWLIQALGASNKIEEAIEKSFYILGMLGESLPSEVTPQLIYEEVSSTKTLLDGITKDDVVNAPKMIATKQRWILKFLCMITSYLFIGRHNYVPIVSCRMVKLSVEHGYCSDSAHGLIGYSSALISVLHDIEEGYRWGKIALALIEACNAKDLIPKVKISFHSFVSHWKEPIQATSKVLQDAYRDALMVGDVEFATISAWSYCTQSLMCGVNLLVAERENDAFLSKMAQLKQSHIFFPCCSQYLIVLNLLGSNKNPFELLDGQIHDENELLEYAISKHRSSVAKGIYFNRLFLAFWFKRYEEAAAMAKKYRGQGRMAMRFSDSYHLFYEGLTAFHFARTSLEDWMDIGENALQNFQVWGRHCQWNCENKLFLLEAEWHFIKGDMERAKEKYQASIESARRHRFVHEEGLALELYGAFCDCNGDSERKVECIEAARNCYEKWGACVLVDLLPNSAVNTLISNS